MRRKMILALGDALLGDVEPALEEAGFLAAFEGMVARLSFVKRCGIRALILFHWAAPLIGGATFLALTPAARRAHLDALLRSRIEILRRSVAVFHTLACFSYYSRPESWKAIGYDGPWIGRIEVDRLPDPVLERHAR